VTVAPGTANGQRIDCPRCGEAFVLRRPEGETGPEPNPDFEPATPFPPLEPPTRSNRTIALAILGCMVLMAVAGLTLALFTQKARRTHDTGKAQRPRAWPPPVETTNEEQLTPIAPARLAALGYLPGDTTLLAGVRVAEIIESQNGKQLLADPISVGGAEFRFADLEKWTGLKPEEMDHLVVGGRLDVLPPRVTLVVRTRRPYHGGKILAALQANRAAGRNGAFTFEVPNLPLKPEFRFLDSRTVAVGVFPGSLDTVSPRPHTGIDHLPDDVRLLLQERMKPGGPLWAVATLGEGDRERVAQLLGETRKDLRAALTQVRALGAWLELEPALRAYAVLQAKDEAGAESLTKLLPNSADHPNLKTNRQGTWLTLQLTTDLDAVRRGLRRD
jgi:hypothetical protein